MSDNKDIAKKKYIAGQPLEELMNYLTNSGFPKAECKAILLEIHNAEANQRKKVAVRDLIISILSFSYAFFVSIWMLYYRTTSFNALYFVSLFLWIPFFKSSYYVFTHKTEFDCLDDKTPYNRVFKT